MFERDQWITQAADNVGSALEALTEVNVRKGDVVATRRELARVQEFLAHAMAEMLEVD